MEKISENKCFGGIQGVYSHDSAATGTPMTFAVFLPDEATDTKVPLLWFLSGLTCTTVEVASRDMTKENKSASM